MGCMRKEDQSYKIHVCFNTPGARIYERLRFTPQVSPWFLRPFGILLWSALNALLVVGGALLLVSAGVIWFLISLLWASLWLPHFLIFVLLALIGGVICLSWVLVSLSWSLMCEIAHFHQVRVACRSFVALWVQFDEWMCFTGEVMSLLLRPCVRYTVREWRPWCRVLERLGGEVVHMHDAIVI